MLNSSVETGRLRAEPGRKIDAIISPAKGRLKGRVLAQPSKNYTTRYLLAAAIAQGQSLIRNCAFSADAQALKACLTQFGAALESQIDADSGALDFRVTGFAGKPRIVDSAPVNPGNAGAVLRFLLALGALAPGVKFITDHPESLGTRPNGDLLDALKQLGCDSVSDDGKLPITLSGGELHGGDVSISGSRSSQFLSGLLFLAPLIGDDVRIKIKDTLVSKAPVRQTIEVLRAFGVEIDAAEDLMRFTVKPAAYESGEHRVNGDWPGSAALLAAVAATGGEIDIPGLYDDEQGEKHSADVLDQMGAVVGVIDNNEGVSLASDGHLSAVEFDGDLATDAVLALMGAACFASGRSRFYNVSNLRIKECDRISEPIAELRKLGVQCWEGNEIGDPDPDAIIIDGAPDGYDGGVTVDGRGDHRLIMLLSIVALKCRKPVRITGAHQVAKSYPDYFVHLGSIGAEIEFVEPVS